MDFMISIALLGLIINAGMSVVIFKVYRRLRSDEATETEPIYQHIYTQVEISKRMRRMASDMQELALAVDCFRVLRRAAPGCPVELQNFAFIVSDWAEKIECTK